MEVRIKLITINYFSSITLEMCFSVCVVVVILYRLVYEERGKCQFQERASKGERERERASGCDICIYVDCLLEYYTLMCASGIHIIITLQGRVAKFSGGGEF